MSKREIHPPRWATRLLTFYCRPELLEDLQGDLNEYFARNLSAKGARLARTIYCFDVLKFIRPYTIRKPRFLDLLIQWIMIRSYITTSGRNIRRNKLFSTINIVGLAVSMSVGLLMIAFLSDILSYDTFHEKKDRIYRLVSHFQYLDNPKMAFASTSVKAGKRIRETLTGIEGLTLLRRDFSSDAHVGDHVIPVAGLFADESFFDVFTFPLINGNPATALKEPYSIVITEKISKKLFGNDDALGKSVRFDTLDYVVTGVMQDVPTFSHIQFESLVSFSTEELLTKDTEFNRWRSIWQNYVYVVLAPGTKPEDLQNQLDKLCQDEQADLEHSSISLSLQPLKSIALGKELSNQIGPVMPVSMVWIIGSLAFVVVLSACFNYTNLSIARSLQRSREVGIRKVIGALKTHVLTQFVCESVMISVLALIFSFGLFLLFRPQFLRIAPEIQRLVSLDLSLSVILYFLAFAIVVGTMAGILPALYFSRINASRALKNASTLKVFSNVSWRKALIVVQYTVSLIFIASTIVGYKQYRNLLTFDLGFSTANVLNINVQKNPSNLLIKELREIPEVSAISQSLMITSVGNYWGTEMKYKDPNDSAQIWYNSIDENYLPLHGHKLLAGRNFTARANASEETEVIINESLLKRFAIGENNPAKAIGETITVKVGRSFAGKKVTIIGVLKDFHYGKVESKIEPVVFRYLTDENDGYVNIKVASTDLVATMGKIDKAWRMIDKIHPLKATFYDDQIEQSYGEFSAMLKIIGLLAFLAICIASIGLFGMVIFTTETRLKEISIRKVLGANEGDLIYLLSKGFMILLAISTLIAVPVTYFFFDRIILPEIVYHAPIGFFDLFSGVLVVMVIAALMIGSQTIKVAKSNPATILKSE